MSVARGRVAALSIHHGADSEAVHAARLELVAVKLREHLARVLQEPPDLTAEQRRDVAEQLWA